jgi:hypothetical protein
MPRPLSVGYILPSLCITPCCRYTGGGSAGTQQESSRQGSARQLRPALTGGAVLLRDSVRVRSALS